MKVEVHEPTLAQSSQITQTHVSGNMQTATDITPAPISGKFIHISELLISASEEALVTLQMETSGNELAKIKFPTDGGTYPLKFGYSLKSDAVDKKIQCKSSTDAVISTTAWAFSSA